MSDIQFEDHPKMRIRNKEVKWSADCVLLLNVPIWWNVFPLEIINALTLDIFKGLLYTVWALLFPSPARLPRSINVRSTWFEAFNSAALIDQDI